MFEGIERRFKLHDVRVLVSVVEAGSMHKAAERLGMSQPAISRSIADLERAFGARLLDRSPRGIELTPYGRVIIKRGVAAFDEFRQGMRDIEFLADPTAGEVRVGSITPLAASFVSAVIDRLCRRYPRIVFHVLATQVETLHRELSERNLDLLITPKLGLHADEQFGFETLYNSSFVVVAGAQNPWVRRRRIKLAELMNESWVLPSPDRALGPIYSEIFRTSGLDYPHMTVVTISPEVRISLLATGRFLTIFPDAVLRFPVKHPELEVLPVELPTAQVPVGIVTLKHRTLSPVVQRFIDGARELATAATKGN